MRSARGFTLIEVVTVVVIIGIISVIAMPRFGNSLARYRVEHAAKRLQADLILAREFAVQRSEVCEVVFTTGSTSGYSIAKMPRMNNRSVLGYGVSLSDEPYRAAISAMTLAGGNITKFDGFGMPDASGSISLMSGQYKKTVVIDGTTGSIGITTP